MESQDPTLSEIQQLKNELEASIGQLLLAFSERTKLRVIDVRLESCRINRGSVPDIYHTKILTSYPFQ